MPFRLAPDLREAFAQQAPTSLAGVQTDAPPVTTTIPTQPMVGVDPNQPLLGPPGSPTTMGELMGGYTPQGGSSPSGQRSQPRYSSVSEIPKVNLSDYEYKVAGPSIRSRVSAGGLMHLFDQGGTDIRVPQYFKARLGRLSNFAKLAGYSDDERKAMREEIRFTLDQGKPATGETAAKAWKDMTHEEQVAQIDATLDGYERQLFPEANAGPQARQQEDPTYGGRVWDNEQILRVQAAAVQYMQPYVDKLNSMGMSDLAAAYMNQAVYAPLIAQAQQAQQLARESQTYQNQLASYQASGSGSGDVDAAAALANLGVSGG